MTAKLGRSVRTAALGTALVCALSSAPPAHAAESTYPARPVRLVVPFAAGGPTDILGRLFAEKLTAHWGRQVVVDSRPGASGIIGADIVAKSNPDGYTILFGSTSTFAVNGVVLKNIPYDIVRDFSFIGLASNGPHVLMVRNGFAAKTVPELIAMARKQPGQIKYGSAGTGTIIHMTVELFRLHTGVDIVHVPYKGGGPSVIALLGGEVDLVINDLSVLLPHIKSGKAIALAASHTSRLAPLPDVPTFAELGFPGIVASTWFGVAIPVKTPAAIRAPIADAHRQVVARADYRERLATLAMEPLVLTPQETAQFLKREIDKWQKVVDTAGIKVEN
ncbi:MAG TPA: tripartite tricarboxylate transporter substrate binding protein [Burkholderiales bacterium]|nr:tripartite tricarboxylate transporter substrate binding protein [Burkholderiales bacterium]